MKKPIAKATIEHNQASSEQNRIGLERLMFFSDAVFAIAITLLVLDIRLPAGGDTADNSQLFTMLTGLWHKYLAYFISFWVIGLSWISHHRKFLYIKKYDHLLLSLNLLFLMVIAFIPFPTAVISENSNHTATIFYALVIVLAVLLMAILWLHAIHNNNLVDPRLSQQLRRREMVGLFAVAAIFLLSIGVAFIAGGLVRILWLLIIPVSLLIAVRREAA